MSNDQFYVEQYKSLRQEIDAKLKDRLELNRWGLIGLAALYSYIFSNPGKPILFWVPVSLSLAMLGHLNEEHRMVDKVATYIREKIEPWAAGAGAGYPQGWEAYLKSTTTPSWWFFWHRWPGYLWDWTPVPLWILVFVLTLAIAIGASVGLWPSLTTPPPGCSS
jgi:hypothetical protein